MCYILYINIIYIVCSLVYTRLCFLKSESVSVDNPSVAELIEKMYGSVRDCQLDILQVSAVNPF